MRNDGWVTLHAEAGETGMGETPNSVLEPFAVSASEPHHQDLVLRPLTGTEVRAGGVVDSRTSAPCPPDVALTTDGQVTPGTAERVEVAVTARCADGLRGVDATVAVPTGWTVTPASADLGTVAAGTPETAVFQVTAPAGTDIGSFDLTATVGATSGAGFPSSVTAEVTVRTPLPPGQVWLSDQQWTGESNGWGRSRRTAATARTPAATATRCVSTGSPTTRVSAGPRCRSSRWTWAGGAPRSAPTSGVDDETGSNGSVVFEVWVDGVRKAQTGVLTGSGSLSRSPSTRPAASASNCA
nr:NEW3 domain-containing protein [Micromonospora lupini]